LIFLAVNLALVVYLVVVKRLFGVRGGHRAYEARLRSESVLEAAIAAAAAKADAAPEAAGPTAVSPSHPPSPTSPSPASTSPARARRPIASASTAASPTSPTSPERGAAGTEPSVGEGGAGVSVP